MPDAPPAAENKYRCIRCDGSGCEPEADCDPAATAKRLWQAFCEVSRPTGHAGDIELFDIPDMEAAAWDLYQLAVRLAETPEETK